MQLPNIRKLVSGIGLLMALVIALGVPGGFFAVGYDDASDALAFKARLSASRAAKYIFAHDRLWQYHRIRLVDVIAFPPGAVEPLRQSITDLGGNVVVQELGDLAAPTHGVRVPVVVGGETVAWLHAETSLRPLLVNTVQVLAISCLLGLGAWITARMLPLRVLDRTLLKLSSQSARFQAALDNMAQGLCMFDRDDRLVVHNRRFAEMFTAPSPGVAASELPPDPIQRGQGLNVMFLPPDQMRHDGEDGRAHELPDGRIIQVLRHAIPGEGWVATYEDITERRKSQERLSHMARHDALTGLPNRLLFREHAERVLPRVRRGGSVAVLCLDLDGFKEINDMLGHPAGDELLRLVARRLKDNTREMDLIARLGGDEFAIIQVDAEQPAEVASLADRLVAVLQVPFDIKGQQVEIGTSIGVVLADETMSTYDELLHSADIALYRAKTSGRGTWRFFEPGMDAEIRERRRLEADLRCALTAGQFEIYYQPLVEARTQTLTGFEALVRWRHPERGVLPPAEFIPLAEEIGLIKAIGAWVLGRACLDAAKWPEHIKVAVNLSPVQFVHGQLVHEVERALADSGLPASRLELEVTESVLLQDNDSTMDVLHRLHDLGVSIAMDDFGTGYSSLSYLRRFPFQKIKIDKSFVQSLDRENSSIEIIRAVVGLGKALGMQVIAEGVETVYQLRILREEGCDELQGYLFSEPRPLPDVQAIITRHQFANAAPSAGVQPRSAMVQTHT